MTAEETELRQYAKKRMCSGCTGTRRSGSYFGHKCHGDALGCQRLTDFIHGFQLAKDVCPECKGEKMITWGESGGLSGYGPYTKPCPKCQAKGGRGERRKGIFNAIESARFTMEHTTLTGTDIKATNVEPYKATEAVIRFLEGE